jgi:hypothetical protein
MQKEPFLARTFFERDYITGKASRVIRPFNLKPGTRVLILARKSGRERGNNLCDQEANLREIVDDENAKVVGTFAYKGSGFDPLVGAAAIRAKRLGADVILAETTDRFVRNHSYHSSKRPALQATDRELASMARDAEGVPLMTHLHPDASPSEVRSYQSKRGQRYKRRKGGRPENRTAGYKKRRQEKKLGLVLWLHRHGWSRRRIAAKPMVSVPKSTVDEWIQRYG